MSSLRLPRSLRKRPWTTTDSLSPRRTSQDAYYCMCPCSAACPGHNSSSGPSLTQAFGAPMAYSSVPRYNRVFFFRAHFRTLMIAVHPRWQGMTARSGVPRAVFLPRPSWIVDAPIAGGVSACLVVLELDVLAGPLQNVYVVFVDSQGARLLMPTDSRSPAPTAQPQNVEVSPWPRCGMSAYPIRETNMSDPL